MSLSSVTYTLLSIMLSAIDNLISNYSHVSNVYLKVIIGDKNLEVRNWKS
jgi:hypothetical protein